MKRIYLDHSATTPLDPKVFDAMKPYFTEHFGNPGSMHSFGQEAKMAIDKARITIANFLGCKPEEIIFTSGGSESDNLAIRGIVSSSLSSRTVARDPGSKNSNNGSQIPIPEPVQYGAGKSGMTDKRKPHLITSAFEHKAVLDTIKDLEESGQIEATYIKPHADGLVHVDDIKNAIQDNTVLVSIMYVNNEIGTIQPIGEIGKIIREENSGRQKNSQPQTTDRRHIFFHTDAVQAIEHCDINPDHLGVDLMSASAHKFYGPKGIGFLYIRKGTPIKPEITGGGQEWGLRAATENVPGIVGMATAIDLIKNKELAIIEIGHLRDKLIDGILEKIPNSILNGQRDKLAPHIANISFVNAEGESILLNLDFLGIAVSTGSACTSRTLEPSHVLTSMGVPPEKAHGSIRFSLGHNTTEAEIDRVIEVLPGIIEKLRAMSPFR